MDDSDSSPQRLCVCGVGENWNVSYCSFSVLLLCAVTWRRQSCFKYSTRSLFHSDEMINVKPSNHYFSIYFAPAGWLWPWDTPCVNANRLHHCSYCLGFCSPSSCQCLLSAGEELGLVPSHESHVSGEQRGRQWAEWDPIPAGETGEHSRSGVPALEPAVWAQRTGRVSLQIDFRATPNHKQRKTLVTALRPAGALELRALDFSTTF